MNKKPMMYIAKCPIGHRTTNYRRTFRDEVNNEDISIFYCYLCKKEFRFT